MCWADASQLGLKERTSEKVSFFCVEKRLQKSQMEDIIYLHGRYKLH